MEALIDYIKEKQAENTTIILRFKHNPDVYITSESSVETISKDLIHIISDVSKKGVVDSIYNINDFSRVDIVKKKKED